MQTDKFFSDDVHTKALNLLSGQNYRKRAKIRYTHKYFCMKAKTPGLGEWNFGEGTKI